MEFTFKKNDEFGRKVCELCKDAENKAFPVLTEKDEQNVVYHLLYEEGEERQKWLDFLNMYTKHYPLSNLAGEALFARLEVPEVRQLAKKILQKYGCAEKEALLVCEYFAKTETADRDFFEIFLKSARVFYSSVFSALSAINPADSKAAEVYKQTVAAHIHSAK